MSINVCVVAWDPTGRHPEGSLLSVGQGHVLESEGAAVLPIDPELRLRNGAAGFVMRRWGLGWALGRSPAAFCPFVLHCVPGKRALTWRMRVRPAAGKGIQSDGFIRFSPDATQAGATTLGFGGSGQQVNVKALGELDRWGGWTVGGLADVSVPTPSYVAVSGYGFGEGLVVEWLAATQT